MNQSCCVWALSGPDIDILTQLANLGFHQIDVQPFTFTQATAKAKIDELGLRVTSVGASFGLPQETSLDNVDEQTRGNAVAAVKRALDYAAEYGAQVVYVIPEFDVSGVALDRYAKSLVTIADAAAVHGLAVCVEHFPGRALPTAAGTLDYLAKIGHDNLYLLFDLGHIQISKEDPVDIIHTAQDRLGFVHLDDNDGQGDLHWSLLDGVMTEASLTQTFNALDSIGYTGPISLELSPKLPNPLTSLQQSKEIIDTIWANR